MLGYLRISYCISEKMYNIKTLLRKCFFSCSNYIFVLMLINNNVIDCENNHFIKYNQEFRVIFHWNFINFTWASQGAYQNAFNLRQYVPLNNVLTGLKVHQDKLYVSLPRFYPGTPATLATLPFVSTKVDPLLQPYPSWKMNVGKHCSTLQNVYSMEIDTKGIMWVIDGFRTNNLTNCPPKIVLLDINRNGEVLQTYQVPPEISARTGGWMNDIVIDESDGGYAFITEASAADPGLIIFSRSQNKAWKIRDRSMFAELNAAGYVVKGVAINSLFNVDGIALAPKSNNTQRLLYYSTLTGYNIYAISTRILKNETLCMGSDWRKQIQFIGRRHSDTDGMIIDSKGNLYFGLLTEYSIGRWNINEKPFDKHMENIYQNYTTLDWPDTFGMDVLGNLYVTATGIERIVNTTYHPLPKDGVLFRILQTYTGTKSYLYS